MQSWDLFDTLVTAKPIAPAGEFLSRLYPIAEMVSRVSPEDIVVSDYYFADLAEKVLREVTGLKNRIVVSDGGKANGSIWKTLPRISKHRGDNPQADVESARSNGIQAELITLASPTQSEKLLLDAGLDGLALACREARLTSWHPRFRQLQLLQSQANFPAIVLAGIELHNWAIENKIERLLMSARDCYSWVHLQRDICRRLGGHYECEYTPSSRFCRDTPTPEYLAELNSRLESQRCAFVDVGGTGKSIARLFVKTSVKDVPTFYATRYEWKDEHPPIDVKNQKTLVVFNSTILERANTPTHSTYLDWTNRLSTKFDWGREEIVVLNDAFEHARKVLLEYPLPTYKESVLLKLLAAADSYNTHLSFLDEGKSEQNRLLDIHEKKAGLRGGL